MPEIRVTVSDELKALKEKIGDSWPQILRAGLLSRATDKTIRLLGKAKAELTK